MTTPRNSQILRTIPLIHAGSCVERIFPKNFLILWNFKAEISHCNIETKNMLAGYMLKSEN